MSTRNLYSAALSAAAVVGVFAAGSAWAATDTTTFQVTATVNNSCQVTATDLAFGTYDPNAGDLDATSVITATCTAGTAGTAYQIALDAGSNGGSASATTRAMTDGTNFLDYELYLDAARSNVWGDTLGSDTRDNASATAGDNNETVYGQVPGNQFVSAGSYTDTINVTINF